MKRANGMGTITRLRNGLFRVRRSGGKRETLGIFETQERAESMLRGWNAGVASGDILDASGVTLAHFGSEWLVRRRLGGNRHAQKVRDIDNEESLWSTHIASSRLGNRPIASIRRIDVEDWTRELARTHAKRAIYKGGKVEHRTTSRLLSTSTIRHALRVLSQCFDDAVAREYMDRNPAEKVSVRRSTEREREHAFLSAAEIEAIAGLPAEKRIPLLFTIYTGARQSEMWRLKWADVDTERAQFWIRGETKNGKARKAPLLPIAIDLLAEQRERSRFTSPADFVFPNAKGKRWGRGYDLGWADTPQRRDGKSVQVSKGVRSRLGITRNVRFHDLRHTCASHLLMGTWGASWRLEEVREYLAHSSISVTERYAHLTAGHLDELAARTSVGHGWPRMIENLRRTMGDSNPRPTAPEAVANSLSITDLCASVANARPTQAVASEVIRAIAGKGASHSLIRELAACLVRDGAATIDVLELYADPGCAHANRKAVEIAANAMGRSVDATNASGDA